MKKKKIQPCKEVETKRNSTWKSRANRRKRWPQHPSPLRPVHHLVEEQHSGFIKHIFKGTRDKTGLGITPKSGISPYLPDLRIKKQHNIHQTGPTKGIEIVKMKSNWTRKNQF